MARKGKEIDLGGLRIQVDPLVLVTRILLRQKTLLAVVALLGGIATATAYLLSPKLYSSRSNILIRYENFEDSYLQKLLNVAVGYLGADLEMMLIVNELDLYAKMRARLPYEMALREIRRELSIRNQPRNIEISFLSKDPVQAQRVVAFTTERLLGKMAELNEAPYNREIEALTGAITELEPKKQASDAKLFEFRAAHPEVANRMADFLPSSSPLDGISAEIRRAEADVMSARSGKVIVEAARAPRNTPTRQKLAELEAELLRLKSKFTDDHPEVIRMERQIEAQKGKVREEQASLDGVVTPGLNPEEARRQRVARAEARLRELIAQKVEFEKKAIKTPKLQREWAELSLQANTYGVELSQRMNKLEEVKRDRLVAANRFQENFQLMDAARVPELPAQPNRNQFMVTGMAFTALIGILLAAVREALRQTFVNATEFEEQTALQVFAVLPSIKKREA
ncbi:MAG: hypothetical protein IT384_19040 [Deltaproteobacteria bacterium]|nr:hypothetical protein [Deltaproteobacteria bacterium]